MSVLDLPRRTGVPTGASVMDERTRRRIGSVLVACGLALLPWLVMLATGFPAIVGTAQESLTWVGLDSLRRPRHHRSAEQEKHLLHRLQGARPRDA